MIKKTAGIKFILLAGLAAFFVGCSQDAEIVREIIYKRTCDIVYNSNGGTGKMESSYVPEGENAKLKENEFTKLGYTFAGWLEAPVQEYDEKGEAKYTLYSAGQEVSVKTNVTFYAQWKEIITRKISLENPETVRTIPFYLNRLEAPVNIKVYFQTIIDEDGNEKLISDIPFIAMENIPELTLSSIFFRNKPEMLKDRNFYSFSCNDELLNFYFDTNQILMTDISTFNKSPDAMPGLDLLSPNYEVSGEKRYFDRLEDRSYSVAADPTLINLDNYDIHLLMDSEGNGYVPLQTFIDLTWEHITGAYNGNALYYISDSEKKEHFYSNAASKQPSWELVEFNFNETCMVLDCFYGLKKEHSINDFRTYISSLNMKDGSSMLESFLNDDPLKPSQALYNLIYAYFDDVHSAYILPSPYISADSINERLNQVKENSIYGIYCDSYWKSRNDAVGKWNKFYKNLDGERIHSMYEDKEYDDGIVIILTFDSFKTPVYSDYYNLSEALRLDSLIQHVKTLGDASNMELVAYTQYKIKKYIEEGKSVKAVVIDLSCNGGGSIDAGIYMSAWIKSGEESYILKNTLTNAQSVCRYKIDTNFDSEFEPKNDSLLGLSPDTKIYCLISKASFSCGNYMPASIKSSPNVTLIGQRTGGGACVVRSKTSALGDSYQISSPYNVNTIVNGSAYSVDSGVEPDVYVSNFENLYDRTKLLELINNLK